MGIVLIAEAAVVDKGFRVSFVDNEVRG